MLTAERPHIQCPVAIQIPEAISLIRLLHRYDQHNCADLWSKTSERLDALESAIAVLHARSREGLFFQACIAYGAADWWDTFEPEERAEQQSRKALQAKALGNMAEALYTEDLSVLADYYMTFLLADVRAA